MVNMVCDGEKFTFEYKEASGDPAPFIAKGDKAKLYWYGPEHEVIPSDREDITYGTRLICLHNITTDNFMKVACVMNRVMFSNYRRREDGIFITTTRNVD